MLDLCSRIGRGDHGSLNRENQGNMTDIIGETRTILEHTLQLGPRAELFDESTELLGGIPELDSMAIVSLITSIEEHFNFVVDDDEINAEMFETLGTLCAFIEQKLRNQP